MNTRLLESKKIIRNTVNRVKYLKQEGNSFIFKTEGRSYPKKIQELLPRNKVQEVDKFNGFLQIEILSDTIFRIRYKEADTIEENETPMVIGIFEGPQNIDISILKDKIEIKTNKININIILYPFRVQVNNFTEKKLCGIGGFEKHDFRQWDSFNTGICYSQSDKSPIAVELFDLDPHEAIYGFGERFTRLNKVGQTIDILTEDASGTMSPRTYKPIPFFVSTKGYGVFFNHSSLMTCWVGSLSSGDIQIAIEDNFLDYFVILGDIKEILSQYTDITGKGVVPPKWSFGYWQSKISYKSAQETLKIARKLRENKIPCDVIHLDTFWFKEDWYCDLEMDKERFPDPEAFFNEMAKMGYKISLWQLPYIPEGSQYFEELKAVDGFVKTRDGEIYDTGIIFSREKRIAACIDFTNPKAVEVYQKWIGRLLKLGAKVIKVDFGEQAPIDGIYHNGKTGRRMHNLYPLLYNQAAAKITKEIHEIGFIWARSAWAGSQRYPVHWGGDSSANWFNLIPTLEAGLSFGLSGFQFWSEDIGGFTGSTGGDLLIRWMQMGLFHSHSRIHGTFKRELYRFNKNVIKICSDYINLRYQLIPYIYGSAIKCVKSSLPMTRALVIEFQDDPNVWNIGDQFLFGDFFLVAPIYRADNSRAIYFPEGTWIDWWTRDKIKGKQWINIDSDIDKLPLYVREGAIIPMGPIMQYIDEFEISEIELYIAPFQRDGTTEFTIPVNNEMIKVEYTALKGEHDLKIEKSKVKFKIVVMGNEELKITKD